MIYKGEGDNMAINKAMRIALKLRENKVEGQVPNLCLGMNTFPSSSDNVLVLDNMGTNQFYCHTIQFGLR